MFDIIVGDLGILFAFTIAIFVIYRSNRGAIHDLWNEPEPTYRIVTRASMITVVVWPFWTSLFDNWRQVIGIPTEFLQDLKLSYASDPFVSEPTNDLIRAVSWLLFAAAVLAGAYLYIRYARGYWGPALVTFVSVVFFFVVNTLRIRFDVDSVRIADASYDNLFEMGAAIFWTLGIWISFVLLIFAIYFMVWGPVTLIGLIGKRLIGGEPEADAGDSMFNWLSERSSTTNNS